MNWGVSYVFYRVCKRWLFIGNFELWALLTIGNTVVLYLLLDETLEQVGREEGRQSGSEVQPECVMVLGQRKREGETEQVGSGGRESVVPNVRCDTWTGGERGEQTEQIRGTA